MRLTKFNWKYFLLVFISIGLLVVLFNFEEIMESKIAKTKMDVYKAVKEGNMEKMDSLILDYIESEIKKEYE